MKHTIGNCPFNSENRCAKAIDGDTIEHCPLHVEMAGKDAEGNDHNEWKCTFVWQPILQVENSSSSRMVAASINSLKNEQVKRQDTALKLLAVDGMKHAEITNT